MCILCGRPIPPWRYGVSCSEVCHRVAELRLKWAKSRVVGSPEGSRQRGPSTAPSGQAATVRQNPDSPERRRDDEGVSDFGTNAREET